MSVAKVVEITSGSPKSFEDAIQRGLERSSQTVQDIRSAWIQDQQVKLENGRVTEFRVTMKVTFLLQGNA